MSNRVVITGIGVVSPIGNSFEETTKSFFSGKSCLNYDLNSKHIVGKIPSNTLDNFKTEKIILDDFSMLAIDSFERMLADIDYYPVNNVYIGIASGPNKSTYELVEDLVKEKRPRPPTLIKTLYSAAGNFIAIKHKIKGEVLTLCAACSSFSISLYQAFNMIKAGIHTNVAVGSSDAMYTPQFFKAWDSAGVTSTNKDNISVPFAKARNGIHHAEGSVFVHIESLESALARNAKIYCEISEVATLCGANSLTNPNRQAQAETIAKAIKNINIDDITYINAHATGTPTGDIEELESILIALGEKAKDIPISSTKQITGHMIGTSGGIELLACIASLTYNKIIPNWFLKKDDIQDIKFNLPLNELKDTKHNTILNNTFAFGGTNVVMALKSIR